MYMWNFKKRVEPTLQELQKKYPHVIFITIKNDNDLEKFYEKIF